MTATVTLRLILYGLVAFVPDTDDAPTRLHALLVDATGQQYASDGCKIHRHIPALYVDAEECTINGKHCRVSDQVDPPDDPISGGWRLDRESLQIEVLAPAVSPMRRPQLQASRKVVRTSSALPASPADSESLAWIPRIDGIRANRDCLGEALECPIAARVDIADGRVTSCHLTETQDFFKVHAFEFKPLGSSAQPVLTQAMSDAVLVTLEIPRGAKVKLTSRDLQAPGWMKREILLSAGEDRDTIDIWLANVPSREDVTLEHEERCHRNADAIDRHFEFYYGLSDAPVPFARRVIPHRVEGIRGEGSALQPGFCPLLSFGGLEYSRAGATARAIVRSQDSNGNDGKVPNDWKSCGNIQLSAPQ